MKKFFYSFTISLFFLASYSSPLVAQKFEFIPFAGYETGARIQSSKGDFHVDGGWDYGAALTYRVGQTYKIEISYSRMKTNLSYTPDASTTNPVCNLALSYISIGGVVDILPDEMIVPFAKIAMGGTFYTPINSDVESVSVMHFDISGGVKFDISDHFGFRFQASLLLPVFFDGIYFPEAAPEAGEGMTTEISGVQGNFTGGLIFRF